MNTEIPIGKPHPFILSEYEFDNGIVFRTKLTKEHVIKTSENIEYLYVLTGPFYTGDFPLNEEFILEYF